MIASGLAAMPCVMQSAHHLGFSLPSQIWYFQPSALAASLAALGGPAQPGAACPQETHQMNLLLAIGGLLAGGGDSDPSSYSFFSVATPGAYSLSSCAVNGPAETVFADVALDAVDVAGVDDDDELDPDDPHAVTVTAASTHSR